MIIGNGINFGTGIKILGPANTQTTNNGSMSFNAYGQVTGQQLSISAANTWAFNSNDFTIEYWLYQSYRGPYDSPFGYTTTGHLFYWPIGTSQNFPYLSGTGGFGLSGTTLPSANSWNHYALVRSSNTISFFLNGANVASGSVTANITAPTSAFIIGNQGASAVTITGQMTDLRVVNGTAVYTANFAPPISPLIAVSNTVLLLNESSSANLTYDSGPNHLTITNANNVTWSANTPYGGMVQGGLFYNLDMKNYVSGNTWPDTSGYNRNFTFYTGNGTTVPWTNTSNVVNLGTTTAYFHSNNQNWAKAPSAFMNASVSYTKGAVIRGNGTSGAPMGSGYLQCSAEARDTTWFNNGQNIFCAGNHTTSAYTDVSQSTGTESLNTWYYVSVTFNPTTGWALYVNGNLVGTSATVAVGPTATTPVIGATQTIPGFNGDIAAAHAYNRALTASEHAQNATYWLSRYNGSSPT